MTIADPFCGAGGTSEGAVEAARASGFEPRLARAIVAASIRHDPNVRFLETIDAAKSA